MDYWERVVSETLNKHVRNNVRYYTPLHDQREYNPLSELDDYPSERRQPQNHQSYFLSDPPTQEYLTQREAECVYLLLQGMTMKRIGATLSLSPRTIEFYLKRIKIKLNCNSKHELINHINASRFSDIFKPDSALIQ